MLSYILQQILYLNVLTHHLVKGICKRYSCSSASLAIVQSCMVLVLKQFNSKFCLLSAVAFDMGKTEIYLNIVKLLMMKTKNFVIHVLTLHKAMSPDTPSLPYYFTRSSATQSYLLGGGGGGECSLKSLSILIRERFVLFFELLA